MGCITESSLLGYCLLQVQSLNDTYKRLQEFNTSLHQWNTRLQSDLETTNQTLKRVQEEKAAVVENLSTLRGHYTSVQEQLSVSRVSFFGHSFFLPA